MELNQLNQSIQTNQLDQLINHLVQADSSVAGLDEANICINGLNLHPSYPIILVGGTNGKGSVCAYLSTILSTAGYRVGSFTSPHIFNYNERICLNTVPIDDATLSQALQQIINFCQTQCTPPINLGIFKAFTLAAHLIFIQQKIDIAIIEVGIGGKQDVTNLFEPTISVITNIALDHCELLGDTLEKIGLEKAGIFRPSKYSFFGSANPPHTLINYAQQIGTRLEQFGVDFGLSKNNENELSFDVWCADKKYYSLPYPQLRGEAQPRNVATSLAVLSKLSHQFPVSIGTIKSALLNTQLIGRFQVMPGYPQIILDVAHNPHAVMNMLQNMVKLPMAKQTIAVFGIAKDKDAEQVLQLCHNRFDKWCIAKIRGDRGLSAVTIMDILKHHHVAEQNIIKCDSISGALNAAYQIAAQDTTSRIICFGSFLVVEEAYQTISNMRK